MTRCQTCFNIDRFCTCNREAELAEAAQAQLTRAWVEHVAAQGRRDAPLLPIDERWQRVAVAPFN